VDPIVVEATDPTDSSTQAPRTPTTTYHFDASGLMTLTVDPEGGETAFEYDRLGRLTQQIMADPVTGEAIDTATGLPHVNSPYTLYEYDPVGNRVRSQDAQGVAGSYWQEWTFDALNRETHAYSKEDVAGVTDSSLTYYQYDLVGNRALLRDPSLNETEWTYNGLDLPDFEQNQQNETRLFEYDLVGNQVQREDRLGRTTGYSYDSLHRQTEEVWYGDMPVNQAPQVLRTFVFEYDLNGRLTDSTDTDAYDYSFDHDNLNRVTDWDYSDLGGLNQYVGLIEMDFDYDLNGNQTIVDATIGGTMDYRNIMSYDYMDRLTSIMQIESDITGSMGGNIIHDKLVEFGYDLTGQFDYITTYNGSSTSSNVISQTDFTFDKTGRLAAKDHFDGNSIHTDDLINGYHYTFDTANRVTSMAVQNPLHSDESVMDYDYNYRDELTFVDYNDDDFNESYEYDENGNRISADNEFGDHDYNSSTSGTYDNNELTGDGMYTYTYDKEGNRLTRTVTTAYASDVDYIPYTEYDWDHRNRLTSVSEYDDTSKTNTLEVVDYTYDDANQLLSRVLDKAGVVSTRYFVHQNGQIVLQFDGSATSAALSHRYIWGPQVDQQLADERVESTSEEGRVLWAFTDHLGTVRDVAEYSDYTTINGTVVWKHRRYDAFGNVQHTIDRGDLNGDTDIDVEDLELLFYAIDNNVFETYDEDGNIVGINDLNGDGYLDELDIQIWVEAVIDSLMGDANLDGTVDGQDFQTWNDNKHTSDPDYEYAEADFNNDGHVNGQDFVIWNNNKFTSAGALNTDTFDYIFGFTGRMLDEATGLQNNLNRWYDAKVGRWISEDPIGFAAGDANVYRYVGNSPTNFIDPSGLSGGPVWYKPWTWGNKPKPKKTIKYSPFKKGTDKVEELATKYFKSACDIKSKRQRLLWVEGIKPKSENQAKAKEIVWQMVNDMPN
jgi:RHS repeat-associated protein